jgi:hypothetical protein
MDAARQSCAYGALHCAVRTPCSKESGGNARLPACCSAKSTACNASYVPPLLGNCCKRTSTLAEKQAETPGTCCRPHLCAPTPALRCGGWLAATHIIPAGCSATPPPPKACNRIMHQCWATAAALTFAHSDNEELQENLACC